MLDEKYKNPLAIDKKATTLDEREKFKLTLRKQKIQNTLFRQRTNQSDEVKLSVVPFKLSIDPSLMGDYRIKQTNINETFPQAKQYLLSEDVQYQKFGAFLFRRFLVDYFRYLEKQEEQGNTKIDYIYAEKFIDEGIPEAISQVLERDNDPQIASELTWTLQNLTNLPTSDNKFDYFEKFVTPEYLKAYDKWITNAIGDIGSNIYCVLFNLCLENKKCLKIIKESTLINTIFTRFQAMSGQLDELLDAIRFFSVICKDEQPLQLQIKQKLIFIFNYCLYQSFDPRFIDASVLGLATIIEHDQTRESTDLIIKQGVIQNVFRIDFSTLENFTFRVISNSVKATNGIIDKLTLEEKIKLVYSINLFSNYEKLFVSNSKINIQQEVLFGVAKISLISDSKVIGDLLSHSIFGSVIIPSLTSVDYILRKISVDIILNCLNLNSFEVATAISNGKVIEIIVTKLLRNEGDVELLRKCLESVLLFIQSGKCLSEGNPFKQMAKNYGLEDFLANYEYQKNNDPVFSELAVKIKDELSN